MKWILAIIVGFALGSIGGGILGDVFNLESGARVFLSLVISVAAGTFTYKYYGNYRKGLKTVVGDAVSSVRKSGDKIASQVVGDDSLLYAIAEKEVEDGSYDKGLWSQALVIADGIESKRKITYMKLRVSQLRRA